MESVRTVFEEKNDAAVYIPIFYLTPELTFYIKKATYIQSKWQVEIINIHITAP